MRAVTVLATGGTIAMTGARAKPALAGADLVAATVGTGPVPEVDVRDLMSLPGVHLDAGDALAIARAARDEAQGGRGVVVTCGTDTLEELAMLCDLLHGGQAPIVFTGANRPASRPGADGPANLADAVAVAAAEVASGLGTVVVFAGEVHAARLAVKVDTTGARAFGSPACGPIGRVVEGTPWLAMRPVRQPVLDPAALDRRVEIVPAHLGADAAALDAAAARAGGVVVVLLGAGHAPPGFLTALERAAARLPVVLTTRVPAGGMLHDTYGFEGSEPDVRATGAIPAGMLTPAAARMKLLAALGSGLTGRELALAFAGDDAHPGG